MYVGWRNEKKTLSLSQNRIKTIMRIIGLKSRNIRIFGSDEQNIRFLRARKSFFFSLDVHIRGNGQLSDFLSVEFDLPTARSLLWMRRLNVGIYC